MKKALCFAAALLFLTGCSNGLGISSDFREIERIKLISTVAIDKSDAGVRITAATSAGLDGEEPFLFRSEASTLAEAVGVLEKNSMKYDANFSHTEHIVLGEGAARDGIAPYLDYISRAMQMRLDTSIFVADGDAGELIENASGKESSASDMLSSLVSDSPELDGAGSASCGEIAADLIRYGCTLIPAVHLGASDELSRDKEEYKAVFPDGFAVIKDGKYIAHIPKEDARAVGFLTQTMKGAYVDVEVRGAKMTLLLDSYTIEARPVYSGESLSCDIVAALRGNVIETAMPADIEYESVRREAENKISRETKELLERAIVESQPVGDYFHLRELIARKAPIRTAGAEESWNELFKNAEFTVSVTMRLERTYDLASPQVTGGNDG